MPSKGVGQWTLLFSQVCLCTSVLGDYRRSIWRNFRLSQTPTQKCLTARNINLTLLSQKGFNYSKKGSYFFFKLKGMENFLKKKLIQHISLLLKNISLSLNFNRSIIPKQFIKNLFKAAILTCNEFFIICLLIHFSWYFLYPILLYSFGSLFMKFIFFNRDVETVSHSSYMF